MTWQGWTFIAIWAGAIFGVVMFMHGANKRRRIVEPEVFVEQDEWANRPLSKALSNPLMESAVDIPSTQMAPSDGHAESTEPHPVHELKIWPQFFSAVLDGKKTFEVRVNDRDFRQGDRVILREFNPESFVMMQAGVEIGTKLYGFTGRELVFDIGYVLPIDDKRVVFSLLSRGEKP